jgi:very-short-patch-repair endonuclease
MSLPEVLLWRELRKRAAGVRFRRQHAIGAYVADFYCPEAKLVVEIDGISHDMGDRPERDEQRVSWLSAHGLAVWRIAASEVLKDPAAVADSIRRLCEKCG